MSKPSANDRYKWIVQFSKNNNEVITTSNDFFVYSYIETFDLSYTLSHKGVVKCQQLARDLNNMVELGILERTPQNNSEKLINKGYPRWSYVFTLSEYSLGMV